MSDLFYLLPVRLLLTALMFLTAGIMANADAIPNYRARFDQSDHALNAGRGYSESLNAKGELAWSESYMLMAYVDMYRATQDPAYLRRLTEHFDRLLQNR